MISASPRAKIHSAAWQEGEVIIRREHMSAKFALYYWPIPFRGNFVKVLFAYKQEPLELAAVPELVKLKNLPVAEQPCPFMAPPYLHDKEADLYLSQLPAIMNYCSAKLGLLPEALDKQALALKVMEDANDMLAEMSRGNGARMWDKEAWLAFVAPSGGRFVRWLQIFEALGTKHGLTLERGFLLGTEGATMADLVVFALLNTMERSLPELKTVLREHAPKAMALTDRLAQSGGLKAFLETQKEVKVWCGGYIEKSIRAMLDGSYTDVVVGS